MSSLTRLFGMIVCVCLALLLSNLYALVKPLPRPENISTDKYWGSGDAEDYHESIDIKPQEIFYTTEQVNRTLQRLNESVSFLEPLEGVEYEYGMNGYELYDIIQYWKNDYLPRFDERQKLFNSIPHFLTQIQGLNIHFLHANPTNNNESRPVIPVLLLHGWPGSVREFYELIPLLTNDYNNDDLDVSFEVIAPSLPGFGWSEGSSKQGFGVFEMSIVLRNLMLRLGHTQFYIQGGDWGSVIGSAIATLFPENVIGYHSNMCVVPTALSVFKSVVANFYPSYFINEKYESFVFPVREKLEHLIEETGFAHLQATKPDTIGAALTDNPVGLAAYILEKFSDFFDTIDRDAILDNLTIYSLTNCFTTSARLYAEAYSKHELAHHLARIPTNVPTGCARFKNDIGHSLDWQLKDKYTNLIHSTYYEDGGHFAALEVPELLHKDFVTFVRTVQAMQQ